MLNVGNLHIFLLFMQSKWVNYCALITFSDFILCILETVNITEHADINSTDGSSPLICQVNFLSAIQVK